MIQMPIDEFELLMQQKEICNRIFEHLTKAKTKHPLFCETIVGRSRQATTCKLAVFRRLRDLHKTAEYVLMEECYEAIDAYNRGEIEHAIDECYDAIAVLLRMAEKMREEL